ncbi:uncharacterized protein LOC123516695 [Portunus trituberculatus]|uniref:uncharacterized protein LOC123516695 n=1 Tax=Portunus trituberculatus TaxID=210409 RepID=UPI001E1D07B2|nr:uncharacterized protein LOC123516695 [Portunus trituberculatus]
MVTGGDDATLLLWIILTLTVNPEPVVSKRQENSAHALHKREKHVQLLHGRCGERPDGERTSGPLQMSANLEAACATASASRSPLVACRLCPRLTPAPPPPKRCTRISAHTGRTTTTTATTITSRAPSISTMNAASAPHLATVYRPKHRSTATSSVQSRHHAKS